MNVVFLRGRLSSSPRTTELGSGDVLVRYEVTVARPDAPADSVPVAWIGAAGDAPLVTLAADDEIVVVGRVRRRWYRPPTGPTRSATEVVADAVVAASDRRRLKTALGRALQRVEGAG